ncbi:MAG TPA: sigma 54-interacting transcriptional regulator [Polyangiaceae bacterium]|nr:sigma 54-interacting transcriptional regulator [Polyangiaceae bacterium]
MRLDGEAQFSLSDVDSGVVVLLGRHVALWIGVMDRVEDAPVVPGLIGESAPMRRLRQQIHRIAPTEMPVLLRGETGVGKEVVAEAIHARSARASNVFVAVNVAGIPGPMAASELFGHRRGAFTGAVEDRPGYFAQANGGTLFLDEIGDVSSEIQTLLLRAIQQGVIQPLGGSARQVDVRLIAATDSDLESAIRRKEFREPLLHRFSLELWVPPLRKRLEDVGLLFFHLLGQHLRKLGGRDRLAPTADRKEPWVPAAFVARLARHSWPGNVRELSNVALKFAVHNRELPRGQIDPELQGLLAGTPPAVEQQPPPAPAHRGEPASDEMIAEAMHAAGYSVVRAADVLGMSRANLYKRLETCRAVTRASDLSATQIADALRDTSGEPSAAARHLRVSLRALVLQMRRLGLDVEDDRD